MSADVKVEGKDKLAAALRSRLKGDVLSRISVGYSAGYALRVHEDLEMPHTNGQAQFLAQPMRTEEAAMLEIVRAALAKGKTMEQALMEAGEHLKQVSQSLVPVRTGNLRDSAYVEVD